MQKLGSIRLLMSDIGTNPYSGIWDPHFQHKGYEHITFNYMYIHAKSNIASLLRSSTDARTKIISTVSSYLIIVEMSIPLSTGQKKPVPNKAALTGRNRK